MKILESRPERYDRGIKIISGGHATRIRQQIIKDHVKPGMDVLDIGCGTGSFMMDAAKAGANVFGIDISEGMLEVANRRIEANKLSSEISMQCASIVEMDNLFPEKKFDLIVSTMVFSELYAEERAFALWQIRKLLKPEGRLVLAVEVRPGNIINRIIHSIVRLPLSMLTYLVSQTGTKPYSGIFEDLSAAGFKVLSQQYSFLGSFLMLVSSGSGQIEGSSLKTPNPRSPEVDRSFIKSVWDYIGRWFPNPVEPGLRAIGKPTRMSPVIVTSNFHLTVRRLEKALIKEDVWLLVAPSNGINVWCGACGGEFNTHSVITAIKTSRLKERIDHNKLILPQFSAPGIDISLLKQETGFKGSFGPAYARHIPEYLQNHKSVLKHNKAEFGLGFRLEMLLAMNFMVWLLLAVIIIFIDRQLGVMFTASFWVVGLILYAGYPYLPGKSGWLKALYLSVIEVLLILIVSRFVISIPAGLNGELLILIVIANLWLGFDLRGSVAGYSSEAEWLMKKMGMKSFGHLFSADKLMEGQILQDLSQCNNCQVCMIVCPKNVFGWEGKNVRIFHRDDCFSCSACVFQCPEKALALGD